jgi:DNA repair protein RecO (recombination protein O)
VKNGIVKTDAVVLKRMDYGETSRIVTLFCRSEGKISVLAKGARSRSHRFGSALEPAAVSHVVFYYRSTRDLQTLTQADVTRKFDNITRSLETISAALNVLEVVNIVSHPGDAQVALYDETVRALHSLNDRPERAASVVLGFRMQVARLSGLTPSLTTCVQCGRSIERARGRHMFHMRKGGVLCATCSRDGRNDEVMSLSHPSVSALESMLTVRDDSFAGEPYDAHTRSELFAFMESYERFHVFHGRRLRTDAMVNVLIR